MHNVHSLVQKISRLLTVPVGVVTGQHLNAQRVKMENSQMNNLAQQYASQLTGKYAMLEPKNVKDASKENQDAILMLIATPCVINQELFAIIL